MVHPLNETTIKAHQINETIQNKATISNMYTIKYTLHAVRWGQNFPNPNGGVILRSKLTTSRCFIRPLLESLGFCFLNFILNK